jgi:hypothetical protein
MKMSKKLTNLPKFGFVFGLCLSLAAGYGFLRENPAAAGELTEPTLRYQYDAPAGARITPENNLSPWLKLRQGEAIDTVYAGGEAAIRQMQAGDLTPQSMATADINLDGYPDLIGGYAGSEGGVLTFHLGAKEAFLPEDKNVLEGIRAGNFPVSFAKEAKVLPLPIAPDFVAAGNFVKDSTLDLAVSR